MLYGILLNAGVLGSLSGEKGVVGWVEGLQVVEFKQFEPYGMLFAFKSLFLATWKISVTG